jgi:hypothetical protein
MNATATFDENFESSKGILEEIQDLAEKMIDGIIKYEPQKIKKRVDEIKLKHQNLKREEIAQKIIQDQSLWGGFLGAVTGVGGAVLLPATIPMDLLKYLKIQAYMICCLAYLYDYPLDDHDALKTDLFLIMSHSSINQLKDFLCAEAEKQVKDDFQKKQALKRLMSFNTSKNVAKKAGQSIFFNYGARATMKFGEKQVMNHALQGIPKIFRGIIWQLGGRKAAEKAMQKTVTKVVPLLGAVVGGTVDWWMIRGTGNVAKDYYQMNGPDFLQAINELLV